jgi:hypothetical protein
LYTCAQETFKLKCTVKQLEGRADAKYKQVMHIVKVAWLYVGSPARRQLLHIGG